MAEIITSKLVIEYESVEIGKGDLSLGSLVDQKIESALANGETLQEITLNIDPDEWLMFRRDFPAGASPEVVAPTKSKKGW